MLHNFYNLDFDYVYDNIYINNLDSLKQDLLFYTNYGYIINCYNVDK